MPMILNELARTALTVLSFGGGQDSTTILLKLAFDLDFRKAYAPGRLLVVMSDTGNEHPATYSHVLAMMKLAKENAIEFILLSGDLVKTAANLGVTPTEALTLGVVIGYHSSSWSTLTDQWELKNTIGSFAFPKSCTDNLKVQPIYRFLEQWIGKEFGLAAATRSEKTGNWKPKRALPAFAAANGKVRVLIGIAKGEEKRVAKASDRVKWMTNCVDRQYPLIDLGLDRRGCQEFIASMTERSGIATPPPSNCVFCPFLSAHELLWLARRMPERFEEWAALEEAKLKANESAEKNVGVFKGTRNLREALAKAEEELGGMTDAELDEYKMSHGHCVTSQY